MTDLQQLRRALADCEGEALSLGGKRGTRVHRLIDLLAFNADVSDAAITTALAGERSVERGRSRGPVLMPAGSGKSIAIVSMYGVALPKFELQPFAYSSFLLASTISSLAGDPSVGAILIDCDSPGGVVTGVPEAAAAVRAARERKPVVVWTTLAASAAYWTISGASEIVVASSGEVGSIGCYVLHVEMSRALDAAGVTPTYIVSRQSPRKTEGNPFEPLSPEARDHEQGLVDMIARRFIADVAVGRRVSAEHVAARFGQGRTLMATDAKRVGMVDRIGALDDAMGLATKGRTSSGAGANQHAQICAPSQETAMPNTAAAQRRRRLEMLRQGSAPANNTAADRRRRLELLREE